MPAPKSNPAPTSNKAESPSSTKKPRRDSLPISPSPILDIPLDLIDEPKLIHRRSFDDAAMRELEISIRRDGVLQAIMVRKVRRRYEIVYGHRRYKACRNLGLATIPAQITSRTGLTAERMKLHENLTRDDLSHIDLAHTFSALRKSHSLTNRQIAETANLSESYVGQILAILDWPPRLREALEKGALSFSVGRELSYVDDMVQLDRFIQAAVLGGCSPSTARLWRADYEAAKAYRDPDHTDTLDPTPELQTFSVSSQCFMCGVLAQQTELIPIWVHPQCRQVFTEAAREHSD